MSASSKLAAKKVRFQNSDLSEQKSPGQNLKKPRQSSRDDPPGGQAGKLEIAGVVLEADDVVKLSQILDGNGGQGANGQNE